MFDKSTSTVDALAVIQDVNRSMADRLAASEILLNRAWGRAKEAGGVKEGEGVPFP